MKTLYLLSIYLIYSLDCNSQMEIVSSSTVAPPPIYFSSTKKIKVLKGTATGFFFVRQDSKVFIITAAHIFSQKTLDKKRDSLIYKDGDKLVVKILQNNKWVAEPVNVYFHSDPLVDIAVLSTNTLLPNVEYNNDIINWGANVLLGQDCFFFGFPLDKKSASLPDNNDPTPLINKGIFSGGETLHDSIHVVYISGNNTYGYSGGPVVLYDYTRKSWNLIGVVGGYYPQTNVFQLPDGKESTNLEKSGLMMITNIMYLKTILAKIP